MIGSTGHVRHTREEPENGFLGTVCHGTTLLGRSRKRSNLTVRNIWAMSCESLPKQVCESTKNWHRCGRIRWTLPTRLSGSQTQRRPTVLPKFLQLLWQSKHFGGKWQLHRTVRFFFRVIGNANGYQTTFKTVWSKTLRRANIPYFRIYDLRSTYATRLSAGGVADEWVTQMLRQGDAQVFKKYSQMKLQMKRDALEKLDRRAGEMAPLVVERMCTVTIQ
jgi:hypothetical protein